jgi:hypothetical protein
MIRVDYYHAIMVNGSISFSILGLSNKNDKRPEKVLQLIESLKNLA